MPGAKMSSGIALDRRAADDGVLAVLEADPRLALAVVVGAPDDQRRVAAADLHALGALGVGAAPDAAERVVLPLAADRGDVAVAGEDAPVVGHLHVDVHHGGLELLEVAAADRVLEERVARADELLAGGVRDDETDHVVGMAR